VSPSPSLAQFVLATRFAVIEQVRNQLAMALVILFVPLWISLGQFMIVDVRVSFRLWATGQSVIAAGNELTQISGALNAVTLIVGFAMFSATFSSGTFDRRLAMAGYPRPQLLLAKVASLILASAVVSGYATAVMCVYWSPRQPGVLALSLFSAAMTYGAVGVVLGTVVRRELEGAFLIVMISVIDLTLQNPIASKGAGSAMVRLLPSYGAMQSASAAGFSHSMPLSCLGVQLTWFTGAAAFSLLAFRRRTRSAVTGQPPSPTQGAPCSLPTARGPESTIRN
jgi:hypothetical protein